MNVSALLQIPSAALAFVQFCSLTAGLVILLRGLSLALRLVGLHRKGITSESYALEQGIDLKPFFKTMARAAKRRKKHRQDGHSSPSGSLNYVTCTINAVAIVLVVGLEVAIFLLGRETQREVGPSRYYSGVEIKDRGTIAKRNGTNGRFEFKAQSLDTSTLVNFEDDIDVDGLVFNMAAIYGNSEKKIVELTYKNITHFSGRFDIIFMRTQADAAPSRENDRAAFTDFHYGRRISSISRETISGYIPYTRDLFIKNVRDTFTEESILDGPKDLNESTIVEIVVEESTRETHNRIRDMMLGNLRVGNGADTFLEAVDVGVFREVRLVAGVEQGLDIWKLIVLSVIICIGTALSLVDFLTASESADDFVHWILASKGGLNMGSIYTAKSAAAE